MCKSNCYLVISVDHSASSQVLRIYWNRLFASIILFVCLNPRLTKLWQYDCHSRPFRQIPIVSKIFKIWTRPHYQLMTVTDFAFYETHKAQHQGQTWKDMQSVRRVSSTDYIQKMAAIGEEVENDFLDKQHNVEVDDLPECVKGSLQISMKRCQKFWIMNPVKKILRNP